MKPAKLIVVLLLMSCASFSQQPADLASRVDAAVQDFQTKNQVPALTVAIAMDGRIVYSKVFGVADVENGVKATPETLIRTGSIAKPISAAAAMTLYDAGKLDLDAPIQKYCPAFPQKPSPITTRQLLGHLSGIRHYKEGEIESTKHYAHISDGFAIFANDPLLFEPGTKFSYTTYGFTVVGCVVEGASGEKFGDYVSHHVLRPAGMTHTFIDEVSRIVPHRARGYSRLDGNVVNAGLMDSSYKIPGGGYVSTAEDLVRFQLAMADGKVVKPATVAHMWTRRRRATANRQATGWALASPKVTGRRSSATAVANRVAALPWRRCPRSTTPSPSW